LSNKIIHRFTILFKKLKDKGFFGILMGSTLVKIMTFASALFLPKVFTSKTEYGILTDVDNIRSYFLLFNGLGISNSVIKYCVATEHNSESFGNFRFVIKFGMMVDVVMMVVYMLICYGYKFNYENERTYLYISTLLLAFNFLLESMQLFLRAQFKNNWYIISAFVYAFLMCISQIILGYAYGIKGVLIGRYIAICITVLLTFYFVYQCFEKKSKEPDKQIQRNMIRFGIICMLGNVSSLIMQSNEKRILSDTICDAQALANYQVSSTIINVLLFLVNAVITFISPYFSAHKDDIEWCYNKYKKIMKINCIIMLPVHLIVFRFAKYFILIIYGVQYLDSLEIMQVMIIASLFQSIFRALPGNILPLLGYEKFNLYINLFFVVIHYICAKFLIGYFGTSGAAVALAIIYCISGLIYILKFKIEYNKIHLK
jgi:O-antigen/teichoic acid export membrane protein